MMTTDEIIILAPPDAVFRLAENIAGWPHLFPHYARVRILGQTSGGRVAEMALRLGPFTVRWSVVQTLELRKRWIRYRYLDGPLRGMEVDWRIEAGSAGTRVSMTHHFRLKHPLAKTALGRWLIARLLVKGLAARTLAGLKCCLEREDAPAPERELRLSA